MSKQMRPMLNEVFTAPGTVRVSAAALQFARDFSDSVGALRRGRYVTTFDWAQSISIRENADAPLEHIGACLTLGAYDRVEVPPAFIQKADDFEFAVRIPPEVWQESIQRVIDVDESLPFKLTLR